MFYLTLSRSTKKLLLLVLSALFAYWLLLAPGTASASGTPVPAPKVYTMSEAQLNTLEKNLDLLEQILAQQDPELTALQLQLAESRNELKALRSELATSREQLQKAEDSLQSVNKLLEKYAQEEKKKRLKIKAQRNLWTVIACGAVVAAIGK